MHFSVLLRSLLIAPLLYAPLIRAAPSPASRPNIIFILTDDLGYGDIGVFYQNKRPKGKPSHFTPHLDQLAAEGITLPHYYTAAPVCAPARASLLSGLHQGHANVRDNQFDKALEDNHNLATVLKAAGYATSCIGKWGLAGDSPDFPAHPLNRGFDDFFGSIRHLDGHEHYPKESPYSGPKEIYQNRENFTVNLDKCYTTDLFTARAKYWITNQHNSAPAQPFFLYLSYDTPHAILQLPTQAFPSTGLQWLGKPGEMINTANGEIDSWIHPDYATATWDHDHDPATAEVPWPNVYQRYATSVRRIDDCVGDLLQHLKDLKIDQETLIVFTSDNGPSVESYLKEAYSPEFFGSYGPFSGIKRDCWEGGVRVGAIARWPAGIPAGRSTDLPCGHWDWLPTFAEMAGLTPPARVDGRSLLPTLSGIGTQRTPTIYIEYNVKGLTPDFQDFPPSIRKHPREQMQMIRHGDLIGIRTAITGPTNDFQIFQVTDDPRQSTNLAANQPEFQTLLKQEALRNRRPLADAARPYDDALIPAVALQNFTHGSLNHAVYPGTWPWLPDLGMLTPSATGNSSSLHPDAPDRDQPHALRHSGFFHAPADGSYDFYLKSSDSYQLRLHETLIIENDYKKTSNWVTASILLKAGFHPLRLDSLYPSGRHSSLRFECSGPDLPRMSMIDSKLCAIPSP